MIRKLSSVPSKHENWSQGKNWHLELLSPKANFCQIQHFFPLFPQDRDSADAPHPLQGAQAMCCTSQRCQIAIASPAFSNPLPLICFPVLSLNLWRQLPTNARCSLVSSCRKSMISCKVKLKLATEKKERSLDPAEIGKNYQKLLYSQRRKRIDFVRCLTTTSERADLQSVPCTDFPVAINTIICLVLIQ